VGIEGEPLGIMSLTEAFAKAEEADIDLVEIAPNAEPPVCRLMDYGKFKYAESKKQHEVKLKQKRKILYNIIPKLTLFVMYSYCGTFLFEYSFSLVNFFWFLCPILSECFRVIKCGSGLRIAVPIFFNKSIEPRLY
jgi:hypothetical protein